MSSAAFKALWLNTDTYLGKIEPSQFQRLRALCEKFYEAGKRHAAPKGQQIVPVEPTDEMAKAGYEAMWNEKLHEEKMFCSAIAVYKAALAAAPK